MQYKRQFHRDNVDGAKNSANYTTRITSKLGSLCTGACAGLLLFAGPLFGQDNSADAAAAIPDYLQAIPAEQLDDAVHVLPLPEPPAYLGKLDIVQLGKSAADITAMGTRLQPWDDANGFTGPFNTETFSQHAGWFKLQSPAQITSVRIGLIGPPGTVRLRIFGQDGGTGLPELQNDLMTPLIITKQLNSTTQVELVEVQLPQPVLVDEHYFFVAVDEFGAGISTVADNVNHEIFCNAPSQAQNVLQTFRLDDGRFAINQNSQGVVTNNAFMFDVEVDYVDGPEPAFKDVTEAAGLPLDLRWESLSLADLDGDDYIDMMASGRLFRNNGGTFTEITESSGVGGLPNLYGANAFIDLENDGDLDIIHLSRDFGKFFINDGNMRFTERDWPEAPTLTDKSGDLACIAIADADGDGFLDFFVGQSWEDWPGGQNPISAPNFFYVNNGDGTFTDRSDVFYTMQNNQTFSRGGARWADYDNDGDQDLLVINYVLQRDELYRNDGDLRFVNVTQQSRLDINSQGGSAHGTGGEFGDYDNDGDLDLLVTQVAHVRFFNFDHRWTTLYRNDGNGVFTDLIGEHGFRYEDAYGSGTFADLNNDGLLDVFLPSFYRCRYSAVYEQQADHTYAYATYKYGFQDHRGGNWNRVYTPTVADINNDGRLDLFMSSERQLRLYQNNDPAAGNSVRVKLEPESGAAQAVGARIELNGAFGQISREVNAGSGVKTQRPARQLVGIGEATSVESIAVRWPDKDTKEVFAGPFAAGSNIVLREGESGSVSVNEGPVDLELKAYPNPTVDGPVTINFGRALETSGEYVVRSLLGRRLQTGSLTAGQSLLRLDLQGFVAGVYFVEISAGEFRSGARLQVH